MSGPGEVVDLGPARVEREIATMTAELQALWPEVTASEARSAIIRALDSDEPVFIAHDLA